MVSRLLPPAAAGKQPAGFCRRTGLFGSQFTVPYGTIFAASVVAVVPIAILVFIFRRSVVSGLTAGAIKQ